MKYSEVFVTNKVFVRDFFMIFVMISDEHSPIFHVRKVCCHHLVTTYLTCVQPEKRSFFIEIQ